MATFTNYAPTTIEGQLCIWLQSYGWAPAKKAEDFKPGETMLFNWGETNEVFEIKEVSKAFVEFSVKCRNGNIVTGCRKKKTSLVAFKANK